MNVRRVIDSIERKAAEASKAEAGDYVVDGLLHCGKCNTPKQCRVVIFGEERKPACLCKCAADRLKQQEAEAERQEQERRTRELRRMGFPDAEMENWTFAKDDLQNAKITKIMQNYVDNFPKMRENGKGLLLYGTVGTGKTFAAACVANALIDKGYPCLMTSFSRLEKTLSGMYAGKQEYLDGLNRFPLLIADDLGAERDTEYMNEIVQTVIDARYRAGLPLIVTTNLTPQELKNAKDITKQRIYSRLFDMCIPVQVMGEDRRREKLRTDYEEFKGILGL